MRRSTNFLTTIVLGACLTLGTAWAEDASKDGLKALFGNQIKDAEKTRSLTPRAKHRGLVMAPSAAEAKEIEFEPVSDENKVSIRIGFDFDSDALKADQLAKLDPLCQAMSEMTEARFRIIGHTDASGEGGYNDNLSLRRALAVRNHLNDGCGIAGERLQAVGVGERYLVAEAAPDAADHRRVEFQALSGTK